MTSTPRAGMESLTRRSPRAALFAAVTISLVLAGQELAFRAAFPLPEVSGFNRSHYTARDSAILPVRRGPVVELCNRTVRYECEPDGFAFDHTYNLYGFRGPDFPIRPSGDRPRILFVGDSFVEGLGAADGQTVPEQFARILGGDRPVEAINLGICGIGFPEYIRLVRDGVSLLGPDAVMLVVFANDLPTAPIPAETAEAAPRLASTSPWTPRILQLLGRVGRGQPIPSRFRGKATPAYPPVPGPLNVLTHQAPPPETEPALLDAMRRGRANPCLAWYPSTMDTFLRHDFAQGSGAAEPLTRIAADCKRAGVRLAVAYVPYSVIANPEYLSAQDRLNPHGVGSSIPLDSPDYLGHQRHLESITRGLGLPFLDLTGPFQEAEQAGNRLFWPLDGHCNEAGYRLIAEVCAGFWRSGEIPQPVSTERYRAIARGAIEATRR